MKTLNLNPWLQIAVSSSILVVFYLFGVVVKRALLSKISNWVRKTETRLDDVLMESIKKVIVL